MLFLDSSALVKRYVAEEGTTAVAAAMEEDLAWTASALARAETEVTLCHRRIDPVALVQVRQNLSVDWEQFQVIPVDAACLALAIELGCAHRVRTLDAIHLAAAARLPRRVRFLTFDGRQADAARAMGFEVVSGSPA